MHDSIVDFEAMMRRGCIARRYVMVHDVQKIYHKKKVAEVVSELYLANNYY